MKFFETIFGGKKEKSPNADGGKFMAVPNFGGDDGDVTDVNTSAEVDRIRTEITALKAKRDLDLTGFAPDDADRLNFLINRLDNTLPPLN